MNTPAHTLKFWQETSDLQKALKGAITAEERDLIESKMITARRDWSMLEEAKIWESKNALALA